MNCGKCQGVMEQGFIVDHGDANHRGASIWYSGRLEWSFWGGLKTRKSRMIYVQTMRCTACGFLESYALTPQAEK